MVFLALATPPNMLGESPWMSNRPYGGFISFDFNRLSWKSYAETLPFL
jgi:hypothetical protein